METQRIIQFLNNLEVKGVLPNGANLQIQNFLDYNTRSLSKLFLIITGLVGISFISAGIFSLIAHNWDDLPKHVKGIISIIPTLVALYFYYLGLFKHKGSIIWAEITSLFLVLMIGASIALVSQSYNLNGDFRNFIKVWLVLILPLFYLNKASGFAIVYLGLSMVFLEPQISFFGGSFIVVDNAIYFWIFFLAYIPHLITTINLSSSKQGFRAIYLGWLTVIVLFATFVLAIRGGHLLWAPALLVGVYIIGKKYFSGNISFLGRPMQTTVLLTTYVALIALTERFTAAFVFKSDNLRNIDSWSTEQLVFYFLGLAALILVIIYVLKNRKERPGWNKLIIYLPFVMLGLIIVHYLEDMNLVDLTWIANLILNIYILIYAANAMIKGSNNKNVIYMIFGLLIATQLMWIRYFDMDYSFWFKGIFFIIVGAVFMLIMSIAKDDLQIDE